jgi:hypothetical protein
MTEPRNVLNDLGCTLFRQLGDYCIQIWGEPAEYLCYATVIKLVVHEKLALGIDREK